jgi:heme a synthase
VTAYLRAAGGTSQCYNIKGILPQGDGSRKGLCVKSSTALKREVSHAYRRLMTKGFVTLAWVSAACAYLLIVLGAVVRISGSGMGCGDHWPLCNGHLFPPLHEIPTVIEWSHRLVAGLVSVLVVGLALLGWRLRGSGSPKPGVRAAYAALVLLVIQVLLGAVTVKTGLTPVLVILHLATAMLLLGSLIAAARAPWIPTPGSWIPIGLAFTTVLFGALTANLGAMASCGGFPLCNGQLIPTAGPLAWIQWIHRLLAYSLAGYLIWWVVRSADRRAWGLLAIVVLQIAIAATMIQLGFPGGLQAAHVAVGAGVWAMVVIAAAVRPAAAPAAVSSASPRGPTLPDTR